MIMRLLIVVLAFLSCLALYAQSSSGAAIPAPKNLQVLPPGADIHSTMASFREGLGVNCSFCHVQGDFASDEKPNKIIARSMILIVKDVDSKLPEGVAGITCYTCHRGEAVPKREP